MRTHISQLLNILSEAKNVLRLGSHKIQDIDKNIVNKFKL